jgi:uncharacterized Fe-S radical SAM superfamily protein PflX
VRVNIDGVLRTVVYGYPCSIHIDPVEKKPLFHFLPGTPILSLATIGCNLHCLNCQNWEISQANPEQSEAVSARRKDCGCRAAERLSFNRIHIPTRLLITSMPVILRLGRQAGLQ